MCPQTPQKRVSGTKLRISRKTFTKDVAFLWQMCYTNNIYQSFVKQTLLSTYDDAWSLAKKLDNATSGNDHKWEEISTSIDNTIEKLIEGDSK